MQLHHTKKKLLVTILYFLSELFTVFGVRKGNRCFGGKYTNITDVPYVVLILTLTNTKGKCTGSIIAPNWVLSAAHCFLGIKVKDIQIIAGIDDEHRTEYNQTRTALRLIIHPKYIVLSVLKWDFALIEVSEFDLTSERVGIISLGDEAWPQDPETMYNRKCLIVGWGMSDHLISNDTLLHAASVIAEHGKEACLCLKSYEKKKAVCLKRQQGVGICIGDSGGPLVCDDKSYGIAHLVYDIAQCTTKDVPDKVTCGSYSTVSVFTYICQELDWIKSYVPSIPERPKSCDASMLPIQSALFVLVVFVHLC